MNTLVPSVIEKTGNGERSYDIFSRLLKDKIVFICGDDLNKNLIKLEDSIFCTKHLFRHLWQKGKGLYFYPPRVRKSRKGY